MKEFSLRDTLESGQIFRYEYTTKGAIIAHGDKLITIDETGKTNDEWTKRFLREDQPEITHEHPYIQEAINNTKGLRVLRQEPFECLVAFIISQNNHQKRIRQNVNAIADKYGKPHPDNKQKKFPRPRDLGTEEELQTLGLGYRAGHVAALRNLDKKWLEGLAEQPYETAKQELMTLRGVGPKVADCVLLFSLGFDQACPEDVWIKRTFKNHKLKREDLGEKAGLIQQHLVHYTRRSAYKSRASTEATDASRRSRSTGS